ncbi:MAG: hypothetical protein L3K17_01860 [Thermoplasmata archaeon]|nr:hypothetical protein [Thermoplasmata archaeon]
MILPGLISAAFYPRPPTPLPIAGGLDFPVLLSGLLGYIQDVGTSRVWLNVTIAIVGGVIPYVAILVYLVSVYFPRLKKAGGTAGTSAGSPTP